MVIVYIDPDGFEVWSINQQDRHKVASVPTVDHLCDVFKQADASLVAHLRHGIRIIVNYPGDQLYLQPLPYAGRRIATRITRHVLDSEFEKHQYRKRIDDTHCGPNRKRHVRLYALPTVLDPIFISIKNTPLVTARTTIVPEVLLLENSSIAKRSNVSGVLLLHIKRSAVFRLTLFQHGQAAFTRGLNEPVDTAEKLLPMVVATLQHLVNRQVIEHEDNVVICAPNDCPEPLLDNLRGRFKLEITDPKGVEGQSYSCLQSVLFDAAVSRRLQSRVLRTSFRLSHSDRHIFLIFRRPALAVVMLVCIFFIAWRSHAVLEVGVRTRQLNRDIDAQQLDISRYDMTPQIMQAAVLVDRLLSRNIDLHIEFVQRIAAALVEADSVQLDSLEWMSHDRKEVDMAMLSTMTYANPGTEKELDQMQSRLYARVDARITGEGDRARENYDRYRHFRQVVESIPEVKSTHETKVPYARDMADGDAGKSPQFVLDVDYATSQ